MSNATKTIGFRVPVETYLELLQESHDRKMNISELVFLRVFSKSNNTQADEEKKALEEKIQNLETALEEANSNIASVKADVKEKQEDANELENQNSELYQKWQKADFKVDELESIIHSNQSDNNYLISDYDSLNTKYNELQNEKNELEAINKTLESENIKITKKLAKAESDSKLKQAKEKEVYKTRVSSLNSEIKNLGKYNEQLERKITKLTTQNTSSETQNAQLIEEVQSLKYYSEKYKAQAIRVPNLINKHNEQVNKLHGEISKWTFFVPSEDGKLFNDILWSES